MQVSSNIEKLCIKFSCDAGFNIQFFPAFVRNKALFFSTTWNFVIVIRSAYLLRNAGLSINESFVLALLLYPSMFIHQSFVLVWEISMKHRLAVTIIMLRHTKYRISFSYHQFITIWEFNCSIIRPIEHYLKWRNLYKWTGLLTYWIHH